MTKKKSISKKNAEGYLDPTAYEALTNIEREAQKAFAFRPVVYICSPLSGDIDANQEAARRYCRYAVDSGYVPIAPHLLFPQFMDDNDKKERDLAMFMDKVFLGKCDELWVFGTEASPGMCMEIAKAKKHRKKIRYFDNECRETNEALDVGPERKQEES